MSVQVVVGMQWGDEGKGKMVDRLAQQADLVVRFQGGDNAGHTVINPYGVFKLHLVPCGIFHRGCVNLIGTGTMVNLDVLQEEIQALEAAGVDTSSLRLSDKAHLVLPCHVSQDRAMERRRGIGTTGRGIGPAYADKCLRANLRAGDLARPEALEARLDQILPALNDRCAALGLPPVTKAAMVEQCRIWAERFAPRICDAFALVHRMLDANKHILFEGQLGVMKDVDLGIYPFVTSSHPVAAYAAVSAGFPASRIDSVCGVFKAFSSAVGEGPFPTEMPPEACALLRGSGDRPDDEYGARTGRPRRLGWLDLPVLRYAHRVNGFTELAMTKLDKLDRLATIPVCTGYRYKGRTLDVLPDAACLDQVEPIYRELEGWMRDTSACTRMDALPDKARAYVAFVGQALGVPIRYVGVGPERDRLITGD